jgi:peptide/nickel transport system substrate-binding protein
MKSTESHWLAGAEFLALLLVLASATPPQAGASTRPQYGGTLRIELHAAALNLDPRQWTEGTPESAASEQLAALVFDRLISLDNYGRFQPQLATDWTHDASFRRWQFTLRSGVEFSDGSALTPADVAAALRPMLPASLQITTSANGVVVQATSAMPDMLEVLASGRYFIYRVLPDGTLTGTGPFKLAEAAKAPSENASPDPAASVLKLRFVASEQSWAGRPFLDTIEVTLGVPPLRAMFDVQLGKADIAVLSPDIARRATQSNLRVWSSAPLTLYALQFEDADRAPSNASLREAVSLSLDRATMAGVLLQKQADPASALLPQWLSGYAFLFSTETNLDRAKELRTSLPAASAGTAVPLLLRISVPGDLAKLLGERVAVNARQSGLSMQIASGPELHVAIGASKAKEPEIALRLLAWRYTLLSPRAELEAMTASLHLEDVNAATRTASEPEQLYEEEKRLLDEKKILPLVDLPDYVGLSPAVRDWLPASWGEWHLADVWLERGEKTPGNAAATVSSSTFSGANP